MKKITGEDLIRGDHIYVRRGGLTYSHHGIYAGERTVIHFKGAEKEKRDPAVIITDTDNFLNGGKLRKRNYQERLTHSESLRIAREHLLEKGEHYLFLKSCLPRDEVHQVFFENKPAYFFS